MLNTPTPSAPPMSIEELRKNQTDFFKQYQEWYQKSRPLIAKYSQDISDYYLRKIKEIDTAIYPDCYLTELELTTTVGKLEQKIINSVENFLEQQQGVLTEYNTLFSLSITDYSPEKQNKVREIQEKQRELIDSQNALLKELEQNTYFRFIPRENYLINLWQDSLRSLE